MPEAQTLLIVSEETALGMPALIWAWREVIWPWPAWRTCPITTCWTCSGSTPERSSAASMAIPPRSVGCSEARPPPILPTGVRALPRITVRGIRISRVRGRPRSAADARSRHYRRPAGHGPDTIVIGIFDGERDRARRRRWRAAGVGGLRRGAAEAAQPRRDPRRRQALHARRAGLPRRLRRRARRVAAAGVVARAKELGTRKLCWELPHKVGDDVAGGFVEGTAARRLRVPRLQDQGGRRPADRAAGHLRPPRRLRARSTAPT